MRGAGNSIRFAIPAVIVGIVLAGADSSIADEADDASPTPDYFTLDRVDAYLEFEGQFDQTRVRSERRSTTRRNWSQTNRDLNLEERFGLIVAGTVLDPSFMTYSADLSFALTQSHFSERSPYLDQSDDDSGYLLLYDARLNFFQGKPLSGSVYALRRDDRINRRFQPSLNERQTGFGTNWTYVAESLTLQLNYDYLETDRTGNNDSRNDEHYTDSVLSASADWTVARNHTVTFTFEHANNKQEYVGLDRPFETTRDLFLIDQRLRFGPDDAHELATRLRWQEESGDFARDIFEIGPQLTLHHSDTLQTIYRYQFNRERYEAFDVATHRADFQVVHQLYSNLTTTVDIFGLYEDIEDDTDTTQYGASVDWQYNRKNRFGHLYADLAVAYDTEDVRGDNGARLVLNESGTFRDPLAITLRNRNVLGHSIVVTDSANRRVYFLGRDYYVLQYNGVTQLTRNPLGAIADGDSVLVDYQYETPARGQIDTVRVDLSLEQRFDNGLTPYYRFALRDQNTDRSTGFGHYSERTDHHRVGVSYEKDKYTLGAEFEVFDDSVEPYDAFHLNGMYRFIQTTDHALSGSIRFSRFFFEGGYDDRNVSWLDVQLDHRWRLAQDLSSFERLTYRWQDDSTGGTTNAWDVTAGVDYVIGELTAELVVEYDRLDLPGSEEDDFGVYLRLRRDFPNVLAVR